MRERLRGALFPLVTIVIAFAIGGLVVILVGANPFSVYKQLAVGAGLAVRTARKRRSAAPLVSPCTPWTVLA